MIVFQSDSFEWDLSNYGITLKEENDVFVSSINTSHSIPITIKPDAAILEKLNLPRLSNNSGVNTKIKGVLRLPNRYYKATLHIGFKSENTIQITIIYGASRLAVYSTHLKDLGWPIILTADLVTYAQSKINETWPQTPFNFPMVYKPEGLSSSNYELFENYINQHKEGAFVSNFIDSSGDEDLYVNRNVMVPFPYLLEIVRFGYLKENLVAVGDFMENATLNKALYVPNQILERFDGSQFLQFSFSNPSEFENFGTSILGVYEQSFVPNAEGNYSLKIELNLDPVIASYFSLTIFRENALSQERTELKTYQSVNNRVNINETLDLVVEQQHVLDPLVVVLKLKSTTTNITGFNNFEFSFGDGQINVFPNVFSLKDFMPDMTFGEFMNKLKNWLNLEIIEHDNLVTINFLEDKILDKRKVNHSHLENPRVQITENNNRFYKLSYANSDEIFHTKDGQIFSDLDNEGSDVIPIKMDVQSLVVERNNDIVTAVIPEDKSKLDFCLYDGPVNNVPLCNASIATDLSLQTVYNLYWKKWLRLRSNSKTFEESFECSSYEELNIEDLSFKYNNLHIIKELEKKFISEKTISVRLTSESF